MMKTKRSQTEIIVTVLLVLIALAAVAAIAYFIMGQVNKGTKTAESQAQCINVRFDVTKAIAGYTNITVLRSTSDGNITTLSTLVDGISYGSSVNAPAPATTALISGIALTKNQRIEINAVLADGTVCSKVGTGVVA
jgi:flagellin-like protein